MSAVGRPNDVKKCGNCGETKPVDQFAKDKSKDDGLFYICRDCSRARSAAYRAANKEKINEWRRITGRRQEKKRKHAAQSRAYYQANRATVAAKTKEWRENNPEKVRTMTHRRRAQKYENGVFTVTDKDLARLYASPCAACGSTDQITADHVIPISRGGHHGIGNLQPLCKPCNSSKNDRLMVEWQAA